MLTMRPDLISFRICLDILFNVLKVLFRASLNLSVTSMPHNFTFLVYLLSILKSFPKLINKKRFGASSHSDKDRYLTFVVKRNSFGVPTFMSRTTKLAYVEREILYFTPIVHSYFPLLLDEIVIYTLRLILFYTLG